MADPIQAAGVVLFWCASPDAPRHYLILQNARHGAWGFPKGHRDAHENLEECAVREVSEETGGLAWTRIGGFHEVSSYEIPVDRSPHPEFGAEAGRRKEVHYFLGRAESRAAALSSEHADAAWLTVDEAAERLQHAENRRVLRAADDFLRGSRE